LRRSLAVLRRGYNGWQMFAKASRIWYNTYWDADDTHADLLLMDEVQGRKVAKSMGLPIIGSVGILINAFRDGLLNEADVETALNRMKQTGRHISDRLIQDALDIVHSEL